MLEWNFSISTVHLWKMWYPMTYNLSGFADNHSIRKAFKAGDIQLDLASKDTIEACMLRIEALDGHYVPQDEPIKN